MNKNIFEILTFLYDETIAKTTANEIEKLISKYKKTLKPVSALTEKDIFLITYGDSILSAEKNPLQTFANFANKYFKEIISFIHFLPFFPYSSDDGFSVIDYYKINPELGDWNDVENIGNDFKLLFDAVINHISAESAWFKGFLRGDEKYANYFIETENSAELKNVFRPRTSPLLTEFSGKKVWTTFSADQIDLNFANPKVLLQIIDLLLFYLSKGAKGIRLDAIAYLWKEIGTSCLHLPKTHKVVELFRLIFDSAAKGSIILTETNVPHKDNISYFGNGHNEAHMVYQFSLPPLTLHAFHKGDSTYLNQWAKELIAPSDETTFFNFLASHDGIGVMPAKGILPDEDILFLAEKIKSNGGFVSYKTNADGTESPYELNCNYFDALYDKNISLEANIDKFIAAHAILISLVGVPAIYIHSLLGSRNYLEGVKKTQRYRSINREKLQLNILEKELADKDSLRHKIFHRLEKLINIRKSSKAFHPNSKMEILDLGPKIFGLRRIPNDGSEGISVLINLTNQIQENNNISLKSYAVKIL